MTKLIGIKELQQNTKKIREEVSKGTKFVVVYRSKPIFEINPIMENFDFAEAMKMTGKYKADFIKRMEEAEADLKNGSFEISSTEEFLKSLN